MEVQCNFNFIKFHGVEYYRCVIKDQQIPENTKLNFYGQHLNGNYNRFVDYVKFEHCQLTKVPQGLSRIFPMLKVLDIENCGLDEISKEDLAEYKNLKFFNCKLNLIEFLPGDLFEGFTELKRIDFWDNEFVVIEPNILNGLTKLEFVNFGYPEHIHQFSIYGRNQSSGTLEEYKQQLIDNYENQQEVLRKKIERLQKFNKIKDQTRQTEIGLTNNIFLQTLSELCKNAEMAKKLEQEKLKDVELIEKLKKQNEALIQQNVKLINSEVRLQAELEQEQLKTRTLTQKLEKGILSDVNNLIQDELAKDFNIIINNQEFAVHRFLLKARSPTLAEVLRNNPETQNINLTDIDVNVFEKILQFLYTDELPREDGIDYLKLFTAAGILKIQDLHFFAGVKSCNLIRQENAVEVLTLSEKFEHDELKYCAFGEIKKFYPNIKFENSWINDVNKIIEAIKPKSEKKRVSKIPVRVRTTPK